MAYYFFPYGQRVQVDSASFALISTTASFATFANTSSFATVAQYPGAQGDPGSNITCECPPGYMPCPNLLSQVQPNYSLVCLEIKTCGVGETLICPTSIPAPTTTTTSTTSTSTTTSTTSTTTSTTSTTTTSTTSTTTEPPQTFIKLYSTYQSSPESNCGSSYDDQYLLTAQLVDSVGTPVTNTTGFNINVVVQYNEQNSCNSTNIDADDTLIILPGQSFASQVYYTTIYDDCGTPPNCNGTILKSYTCITSVTNSYPVGTGSELTYCTSPTTTTTTTSTTTTAAPCYTDTVYVSTGRLTKNSACSAPAAITLYYNAIEAYTDSNCSNMASDAYYGDTLGNYYEVVGGQLTGPFSCTTTTTTTTAAPSCFLSQVEYANRYADSTFGKNQACADEDPTSITTQLYISSSDYAYQNNTCGAAAIDGYYSIGQFAYGTVGRVSGGVYSTVSCGTPTTTTTTTTTTEPPCEAGWLPNSYQCVDNQVKASYQYSNCSVSLLTYQDCTETEQYCIDSDPIGNATCQSPTTTTTTTTTTTGAPGTCYTAVNYGTSTSGTVYWTDPTLGSQTTTISAGNKINICSNTVPYESPAADVEFYNCETSCTSAGTCSDCENLTTTTTLPPETTTTTSTTSTTTTTTIAPGQFVSVAEDTYNYTSIDCLGNPYAGGLVMSTLRATLVNSVGTPITNTGGSSITVTVQYNTFYNNGCGSPSTTTYAPIITNGTSQGSEPIVIENVAECGYGCNTEGISNPCIQSIVSGSGTGPYNIYGSSPITVCP